MLSKNFLQRFGAGIGLAPKKPFECLTVEASLVNSQVDVIPCVPCFYKLHWFYASTFRHLCQF